MLPGQFSELISMNEKPIPHSKLDPIWDEVFTNEEKVLWVGQPDHGRNFWEFEGQEPIYYISMLVGAVVLWIVVLLEYLSSSGKTFDAFFISAVLTAAGLAFFYFTASSRAYIMSNLFYAVTDKKAVIVRRGGNFRMSSRRYVLSFPFAERYAFLVLPGRKYGSVQVGSLLTDNTIQPFGFGLAHPGWPFGRAIGVIPALFESIEKAEEMQIWLQRLTDQVHA